MVISIVVMTENITRNPYCPCRSVDECLNEIRSTSKNSQLVAFFSSSQDETMIRCCMSKNNLFLCISQNTSKEQIKCILHKLRMIHLINSLGRIKYFSLMMEESTSEILSPSTNSVNSEYTGPRSDATELKSTESNNFKKIGEHDTLQIVQHMTADIKTNRIRSPVADAIYPMILRHMLQR